MNEHTEFVAINITIGQLAPSECDQHHQSLITSYSEKYQAPNMQSWESLVSQPSADIQQLYLKTT